MNVVDPTSYKEYAWLFEKADLMVFNYLISENKVRLPNFVGALSEMLQRTPSGCCFTVIDRLERKTSFRIDITNILRELGLDICGEYEIDGVMTDSQAVLEDYIHRFNQRSPRRWFQNSKDRTPTVFAIIALKS